MFCARSPTPMTIDTILVLANPNDPPPALLDKLRSEATVIVGNSVDAFENAAPSATIILNWSGALDLFRKTFAICPNLHWVHSRSAGLDRSMFSELVESPIPLTNGVGVFSASLGEFALGAILYFAKDFRRMIRNQVAGVWEAFDVLPIAGYTVGIVGYGDIGRAVASRVRGLGMKVLALKRHPQPAHLADPLVEKFYTPDQCAEMISHCDYIVVSAPLTTETRGMIGQPEIAAMKPTAVVINVGRGPLIDENALIRALSINRIRGAALDVFDKEPLPAGHAFYKLENVLLSPHCADHTPDWLDNAMEFFISQYERFRKNEPLLNLVNKKLGY
jgi:phosphoglycerate dehydrogenase-like enzyme